MNIDRYEYRYAPQWHFHINYNGRKRVRFIYGSYNELKVKYYGSNMYLLPTNHMITNVSPLRVLEINSLAFRLLRIL